MRRYASFLSGLVITVASYAWFSLCKIIFVKQTSIDFFSVLGLILICIAVYYHSQKYKW
ncbi:MAG: hypothetical protein ACD_47C00234G0006 [uncultured bacterium]|nr:MAG: hypothetical protein ACD_47C00234G0006 [uncultured bacterium]